jgi:transcriptional regulator with XRE-family HTH domain
MMNESLARKLRILRAARGITLREAEKLTGVTRETLGALEHGQRGAYTNTLEKIAAGYGTTVGELLDEEHTSAPLGSGRREPSAPDSTPIPPAREEESLMSRPEVASWLAEEGHLDRESFLSWVEECEDEEDIDRVRVELREVRDRIRNALRTKKTQYELFGPPQLEGLTGDAWNREVFRPGKTARRLANEISREYTAREVGILNYSKVLFIKGTADDYLVYEHERDSEYARERHERMLEAREAAARELERTYAEALA